jgi:hypothetical protein
VVACDLKSLTHVNLLQRLHKLKDWIHPQLSLLNVTPGNKHTASGLPAQEIERVLSDLLKDFQYRLNYSGDPDILRGIITFADQNDLQLIIALPGKHSFLYKLTHQSISSGLSLNAHKPVLILK